jgi:hypothetical protein
MGKTDIILQPPGMPNPCQYLDVSLYREAETEREREKERERERDREL